MLKKALTFSVRVAGPGHEIPRTRDDSEGHGRRGDPSPPTPETPAPSAAVAPCEQPENDEQDNCPDGGVDDEGDRSDADMNVQARQQPVADERADEAEAAARDDLAGQPARHDADEDSDDEALVRQVYGVPL
jgi:hypothetical protein